MENSAFQRLATEIHPALLNDIIEEMPSALLVTDKQGCIRALNQNFTRLTGYSESELLGKNCSILSYKRTPPEIYQNLWETIKSGKKWRGNLINRKKNGDIYIADLSVFPISNSEHLGFYAIHEDVTEQFTDNQQLSNQNSIFETILNAAPMSFLMLNDKLDVVFSNSGLKQQIGEGSLYQSLMAQLTESISETLIHSIPKRMHRGRLNASERMEKTVKVVNGVPIPQSAPAFSFQRSRFEVECRDKGEYRWFECAVEPITLSHGETEHFFSDHGSAHAIVVINDRTKETLY
ncbi:PAS domain S-box protein [Vibrio olivae]